MCFHLRRKARLAKIVVKATTLLSRAVRSGLRDTPKGAIKVFIEIMSHYSSPSLQ